MNLRAMAYVLAGGKGTRLAPLTSERAKPAVSFAGKYRIVDFVLSNLVNSGIFSIYVLVQFKSQSLMMHLKDGWQFANILGSQFIIPVPAQMRAPGENWYRGTADAIWQNINLIEQAKPDVVVVFGADHVYRMNVLDMIEYHRKVTADVTIATIPADRRSAGEFGVVECMADGRVVRFIEKDPDAPSIPGSPDKVLASMGNYVFSSEALLRMLHEDAHDKSSGHDFGKDVLPRRLDHDRIFAYDFATNHIPGDSGNGGSYWRDVGTVDAYFEANMEIRSSTPPLNLYNRRWPLRTASYPDPPARFENGGNGAAGEAHHSLVSGGCIVAGRVSNSVLGRNVYVHMGATLDECVVLDNCEIGAGSKLRRTILDKNVRLPAGERIGFDADRDRQRWHVTEKGVVVVPGKRSPVEISQIGI
ncbi:MAG: glucose-1-phosphate adenylyltransferase [Rhodospirillales bacterium]|nr:glucose-1-phosphate adenylyltransferase [Rhodospirillales bacterium]